MGSRESKAIDGRCTGARQHLSIPASEIGAKTSTEALLISSAEERTPRKFAPTTLMCIHTAIHLDLGREVGRCTLCWYRTGMRASANDNRGLGWYRERGPSTTRSALSSGDPRCKRAFSLSQPAVSEYPTATPPIKRTDSGLTARRLAVVKSVQPRPRLAAPRRRQPSRNRFPETFRPSFIYRAQSQLSTRMTHALTCAKLATEERHFLRTLRSTDCNTVAEKIKRGS